MKRISENLWSATKTEKAIFDILKPFFKPDKKIWFRKRENSISLNYWMREGGTNPKKINELRPLDECDLQFLANHIYTCCIVPIKINIGEEVWVIVKNRANKCEAHYKVIREVILKEDGRICAKVRDFDNIEFEYDKTLYCNKALAEKMANFYTLSGEDIPSKGEIGR